MASIQTGCTVPWHVFTLLFALFWLVCYLFEDSIFVTFVFAAIGGFCVDWLTKLAPVELAEQVTVSLMVGPEAAVTETVGVGGVVLSMVAESVRSQRIHASCTTASASATLPSMR